MKIRMGTIAILLTLFPVAHAIGANSAIFFSKADFTHAEKAKKPQLLLLELSKAGSMKVEGLNESNVGQEIEYHLAGETGHLKLKEAIQGNTIQAGPFSENTASRIIKEVNQQ